MARDGFRQRAMAWRRSPRGSLLAGIVLGLILALLLAAFVAAPLALMHRSNWPLEERFGGFAVSMAARLGAGDAGNPRSADQQTLEQGQNAYVGSCMYCHGPSGKGTGGALSSSLFPPATDLTKAFAADKSDAEIFWIIKNGLAFTAMPAYKSQYNDDTIWAMVTYLRSLQGKTAAAPTPPSVPTPSDAQLLVARSGGDSIGRGGAVYFAQNCFQCHGGAGNAPGQLNLSALPSNDASIVCAIRFGPNGMPAFGTERISDAEVVDLIAYMRTFTEDDSATSGPPVGGPPPGGGPPTGGTPQPDRYSGTANGEPPTCAMQGGTPPAGAPGAGTATPTSRPATPTASP